MLRPNSLSGIVGQAKIKECLSILLNASAKSGETVPHICFGGNAGGGKTTLACAVAHALGTNLIIANGGNLRTIKSILPYIARIKRDSVFFIDEIHRISPIVAEFLYPIMEDFRADIGGKEGVSFDIPRFTMLGATTEEGMLLKPLRDRFIQKFTLEPYSEADLEQLCEQTSQKLGIWLTGEAQKSILSRCRGIPRVLNAQLKWVQAHAISENNKTVDLPSLNRAMTLINVDEEGLTQNDRDYLKLLKDHYPSPLGVRTITATLGISQETIEKTIEPFLLAKHRIIKTPVGRLYVR
jgi:Holliday junction DNA helicase RuvB